MDDSGTAIDPLEAPTVVFATHFRFGPNEVVGPRAVASRMLMWVINGHGRVRTGGQTIEFGPGAMALFPWRHDIRYQADGRDPFVIGGVHIVPWCDPGRPIEPRAAHRIDEPLWRNPNRKDAPWPGYEGLTMIPAALSERLLPLCEAAIRHFANGLTDPRVLRSFGTVITSTLLNASTRESPSMPPVLRAMVEYAHLHLADHLDREVLAEVAGCSASTAERQFRRHLGHSLQAWLRDTRLDTAARDLETSTRRVSEVARSVGFDDPFHFSRVFRARFGVPPSQYARREPLL
ncbi:MAG: helix-turn-helix transcriptional regulator [Microbacteriaceae bacterium]|nr:helix-turn-helix transcriptional regulator [Microbacteriaceae bacterium]